MPRVSGEVRKLGALTGAAAAAVVVAQKLPPGPEEVTPGAADRLELAAAAPHCGIDSARSPVSAAEGKERGSPRQAAVVIPDHQLRLAAQGQHPFGKSL